MTSVPSDDCLEKAQNTLRWILHDIIEKFKEAVKTKRPHFAKKSVYFRSTHFF